MNASYKSVPTVEEIIAAYEETGLKPGRNRVYTNDFAKDGDGCCAIRALWQQANPGSDPTYGIYEWAEVVYGKPVVNGLILGFDGKECNNFADANAWWNGKVAANQLFSEGLPIT